MPTTPAFVADPIPPLADARAAVLAERLHRTLDGGTPRPESKYDRRELVLHVRSAYEAQQGETQFRNAQALQADYLTRQKLRKEWYFDDLKTQSEFGGTRDKYLVPFVVTLHTDPVDDTDYALLPPDFTALGRYDLLPGEGIEQVRALTRADRRRDLFASTRGSQDALLRGLWAGGLEGMYTYCRRGERVEFEWGNLQERPATRFPTLELLLVIRRLDTDELPAAPLLQAAQDFDILRRAQALALKQALEDKVNDNNAVTQ